MERDFRGYQQQIDFVTLRENGREIEICQQDARGTREKLALAPWEADAGPAHSTAHLPVHLS